MMVLNRTDGKEFTSLLRPQRHFDILGPKIVGQNIPPGYALISAELVKLNMCALMTRV
jgi:hypothetical protein